MKDIILAGGSGARLYPMTQSKSKQLLLIYETTKIKHSVGGMELIVFMLVLLRLLNSIKKIWSVI